jgi:hypothetical protein
MSIITKDMSYMMYPIQLHSHVIMDALNDY